MQSHPLRRMLFISDSLQINYAERFELIFKQNTPSMYEQSTNHISLCKVTHCAGCYSFLIACSCNYCQKFRALKNHPKTFIGLRVFQQQTRSIAQPLVHPQVEDGDSSSSGSSSEFTDEEEEEEEEETMQQNGDFPPLPRLFGNRRRRPLTSEDCGVKRYVHLQSSE